MTLSHDDTKELIDFVLTAPKKDARRLLHTRLEKAGWKESEFCAGVIKHGPDMNYTGEQWTDFFEKIPNRLFYVEPRLMNKLSERQRSLITE